VVIVSGLLAVAFAGHFGGDGGHYGGVSYVKTPVVNVNYVAKPVVHYVAKPVATVSHALKPVLTYTTVSHGGGGFGGGGFGGGGYGGGGGHGGWW
ncbi:unnamed protein product, partial [Ixodes persulcatus]